MKKLAIIAVLVWITVTATGCGHLMNWAFNSDGAYPSFVE